MLNWLVIAAAENEGNYVEPDWFKPLMQINDRFGFILWPALALLVIAYIAWSVLKAATHKSIPGPEKSRLKKEILHELRRQLTGLTADQVVKLIGHELTPTNELLAEMVRDGMIESALNSKGATIFRLRGF